MRRALRRVVRRLRRLALAMVPLALWAAPEQVLAADINITAEFTPDARDPNKRTFTNTTPRSGLCTEPGHTATCDARRIWSIDTAVRGTKGMMYGTARGAHYFGMPGERIVFVRNASGVMRELKMRIAGMGFRYARPGSNGSWGGPEMNHCSVVLTNYGAASQSSMRLFHRNDDGLGRGFCVSGWVTNGLRTIRELDIVYELDAANPLEMPGGVYTGSTTYTIGGANADIDLGDSVQLDSSTLTVHFSLTVNHYFDVRFPPGSERAILAPLGGWRQWTDHGRAPTALVKELPFQLSSSSHFGVSLRCQYPLDDGRCGIHSGSGGGEQVPVDVRLTVPGVHDRTLGRDVVDYPLTTTMAKPLFDPQGYVYERASRLSFKVEGQPLADMLEHPGSHYAGDVIVVFDADL